FRTGLTGNGQAGPDQQFWPDRSGRSETASKNCSLVFRTDLIGTCQACPHHQVRPDQSSQSETVSKADPDWPDRDRSGKTASKFARWSGPDFSDRPDRDRSGPVRKNSVQFC
ncbi:hypothetical protein TIFTF001_053429, partial [Ficus carica]